MHLRRSAPLWAIPLAAVFAGVALGNPPEDVGIDQKLNEQVPLDLVFVDESGRKVTLGDYVQEKPVILNLVYYRCPMLCNMVMDGLIRSLRTLKFTPGDEFEVVTVSFDPHEGPKLAAGAKRTAIKRYDRGEGAADGWHFLTGEEPSIRALADAVGFRYTYDKERGQYAHAAGLMVLTPEGRVSRYLTGVEFSARDMRLALIEASDNKIGELADQVTLLCYQYDPTKGKYGLAIMNVIRAAGVATVLAMTVGFVVMTRRGNNLPAKPAESYEH